MPSSVWAPPARKVSQLVPNSARSGEDGIQIFSGDTALDLLEALPNDSAVALVLIENHWAVPLRDAVWRAGGFNIASRIIRPRDW